MCNNSKIEQKVGRGLSCGRPFFFFLRVKLTRFIRHYKTSVICKFIWSKEKTIQIFILYFTNIENWPYFSKYIRRHIIHVKYPNSLTTMREHGCGWGRTAKGVWDGGRLCQRVGFTRIGEGHRPIKVAGETPKSGNGIRSHQHILSGGKP